MRWFWIWIGIMPTCPDPEALQRLALSSHCRNLLKCPAFKTGTSRKRFATKQRVKHTYALSLLSRKKQNCWTWNIIEHSSFLNKRMFQEWRSVSSILSQDGFKDMRLLLYFVICIPFKWFLLLKRLVPRKRTLPARVVQSNKTEFTLWCCWYGEYLSVRRVSCISTWCRIVSINHVNSNICCN